MNAPSSRSSWIKWLLLALLVIAIALGVLRALHFGPAIEAQQDFAAGSDEGQRLERLTPADGAHDVDA